MLRQSSRATGWLFSSARLQTICASEFKNNWRINMAFVARTPDALSLRDERHGPLPALLLTLTFVTGLVDAVSYLRLGHVFVANMTGKVVFLGFSADPRSRLFAAASVIAIAGFVLGAFAGGRAAHHHSARHLRGWLTGAFAAEALIIGA